MSSYANMQFNEFTRITTDDHNKALERVLKNIQIQFRNSFGAYNVLIPTYLGTLSVIQNTPTPGMQVTVLPGAAFTNAGLLTILEVSKILPIPSADPTLIRRDIIQISSSWSETDSRVRQKIDPSTQRITTENVYTGKELQAVISLKTGTPGGNAPSVDSGAIKICEIEVPAGASQITTAQIFNVTSSKIAENNTNWTNDLQSTHKALSFEEHRSSIPADHPNGSILPIQIASGLIVAGGGLYRDPLTGEISILIDGITIEVDGITGKLQIKDNGVDTQHIAPNAITTDEIDDGTITNVKLDSNSVDTDNIIDGAVIEDKIDTNAVTENKIADGAVTGPKINSSALGDGLTKDIADNVIVDYTNDFTMSTGQLKLSYSKLARRYEVFFPKMFVNIVGGTRVIKAYSSDTINLSIGGNVKIYVTVPDETISGTKIGIISISEADLNSPTPISKTITWVLASTFVYSPEIIPLMWYNTPGTDGVEPTVYLANGDHLEVGGGADNGSSAWSDNKLSYLSPTRTFSHFQHFHGGKMFFSRTNTSPNATYYLDFENVYLVTKKRSGLKSIFLNQTLVFASKPVGAILAIVGTITAENFVSSVNIIPTIDLVDFSTFEPGPNDWIIGIISNGVVTIYGAGECMLELSDVDYNTAYNIPNFASALGPFGCGGSRKGYNCLYKALGVNLPIVTGGQLQSMRARGSISIGSASTAQGFSLPVHRGYSELIGTFQYTVVGNEIWVEFQLQNIDGISDTFHKANHENEDSGGGKDGIFSQQVSIPIGGRSTIPGVFYQSAGNAVSLVSFNYLYYKV